MTVDAIANLPVNSLADDNCHLYLWTIDQFLLDGSTARVAKAWGFPVGRLMVWKKSHYGLGTFPRPQHEAVLVCRRGSEPFSVRNIGSVFDAPIPFMGGLRLHSAKPESFFDLVEVNSPGPRLEMFARRQRLGWDTWGNEALEHVELA
jgi:N6-adenosine-specific RNA methylase IME4